MYGGSPSPITLPPTAVYALAVYDGELIAGGNFTNPGDFIARWDGSVWQSLASGGPAGRPCHRPG